MARLIIISAAFNLVLLLANLYLWLSSGSKVDRGYFLVGMVGCFLILGTWWINDRGYVNTASLFVLALYMGRLSLVSEPDRFASAFWAFMIPIIISSFILRPKSSFPTAGMAAILYALVSVRLGLLESPDITLFKYFLLFSLAAVSYFMASHLERSMAIMEESEEKYRTLFNDLPIGLYRTSDLGEILDANPAFLRLFGIPDINALRKLRARDLYANPTSREEYLISINEKPTVEMQMRRLDGTEFWVTDHSRPFLDEQGNILYYEGSLIDITEQKKAESELKQLAITDPLTGLPNRRFFFSQAEQVFKNIKQPKHNLAILMLDIDHFKNVNDHHGHAIGDLVLHHLARELQSNMRANDICGRYGGEEFVILVSRIDRDEICHIAERLCRTIEAKPYETGTVTIKITLSIGVAIIEQDTVSLELLLKRADQALYIAKHAGRNRWILWDAAHDNQADCPS